MIDLQITGAETSDQLIKQLVCMRLLSRNLLKTERQRRALRNDWASITAETHAPQAVAMAAEKIADHDEKLLQIKFLIIDLGNYLMQLCTALDAKAPRAAVLEALDVNRSQWYSHDMQKYGDKTMHVIAVLDLENSATTADGIEIKPLKWCQTMAFMHALQTNSKLDRAVHDGANEFFGGVFGEFQERPLTQRLIGRAA